MFAAALAASVLAGPFGIDLTQKPQGCEPIPTFMLHTCPVPDPRFKNFTVETASTGHICYMGGVLHDGMTEQVLRILLDTYGEPNEPWVWRPDPKFGLLEVSLNSMRNIIYLIDHPDCDTWRKEMAEKIEAKKANPPRSF